MKIIVTNIQRFCLHDGPGIRTTIFFKGCTLHCPWCANPENIENSIQYYYDNSKCIKNNTICNKDCCILKDNTNFKEAINKCITGAIKKYGYEVTNDYLYKEIEKDKNFYKNDGGVTLSGGEPLIYINDIEPLLINLKNSDINITVETSLFIDKEKLKKSIQYVNNFIVDFKIFDKIKCKDYLGGNIDIYLDNLKYLSTNIENSKILVRIPIIKNYTDDMDNIKQIVKTLKNVGIKNVQIFSGHTLAEKKYETLNKKILKNVSVPTTTLNDIKEYMLKEKLKVEIIKI